MTMQEALLSHSLENVKIRTNTWSLCVLLCEQTAEEPRIWRNPGVVWEMWGWYLNLDCSLFRHLSLAIGDSTQDSLSQLLVGGLTSWEKQHVSFSFCTCDTPPASLPTMPGQVLLRRVGSRLENRGSTLGAALWIHGHPCLGSWDRGCMSGELSCKGLRLLPCPLHWAFSF